MPFNVACNNESKITVILTPLTPEKNPTTIDGPLTITVQSGDGTFSQDPAKPLEFKAISGAFLADTVYLVSGDGDMGAGVATIQDTVTLTVGSANAASFGFSAGVIEAK